MWAILTDPEKKGGKWNPDEFFQTGEKEITTALDSVASKGIKLNFGCALDFGCGVGRLSQALARHFQEVHGIDIAPSMVEQAKNFNRYPEKVHYHVNPSSDLRLFPDQKFDFIYTFIVLQHIQPKFVLQYISEFVRTLRPNGVALFQFIEPSVLRRMIPDPFINLYRTVRRGNEAFVWEFGVSRSAVDKVLRDKGAKTVDVQRGPAPKRGWSNYTYLVTRN